MPASLNGNAIFLPAAGNREDSELSDAGTKGYYLSSSLGAKCDYARAVTFDSGNCNYKGYSIIRKYGYSVRPVRP